ncbi:hypothetical protein [Cupriavidus taiwanensis]|uniref:hypothetical protein n=1 Tax=Cupriavidus taiwanensis TaxID=164546 RepID=UPI001559D356|nr:hypothetical protein [Cupriavidus taiwanensis]
MENFSLVRNNLLFRVQRRIGLIPPTGLASRGARWYPNRKECPLLAEGGRSSVGRPATTTDFRFRPSRDIQIADKRSLEESTRHRQSYNDCTK